MARLSREFVKLETRILNDYRFFTMSEFEQLVYIKLLGISRSTSNQIPKDLNILRQLLRLKKEETCFYLSHIGSQKQHIGFSKQEIGTLSEEKLYQIGLKSAVKRIKDNFPKFKENKYFYYFDGYELRLSNSDPKNPVMGCVDEDVDKDVDLDKDLDKEQASPALKAALETLTKEGFNIYSLINRLKKELGWAKDRRFPEEVLLGVAQVYQREKPKIKHPWPWFKRVLAEKSKEHFATQNVVQHKKEKSAPSSLKEIMEKA